MCSEEIFGGLGRTIKAEFFLYCLFLTSCDAFFLERCVCVCVCSCSTGQCRPKLYLGFFMDVGHDVIILYAKAYTSYIV